MPDDSSLEGLLEALTEEARRDSSGLFTLDPRKAIEKFASFQLQGQQWALKVVQAAVAGGATSLELTFRSKEAVWRLKGPTWSSLEIETALWHPEQNPSAGVHHLRVALWSVGFGGKSPFLLNGPGWNQRLRWDGQRFHREVPSVCTAIELNVTYSPLNEVQATLANLAYPCPIPFTVAGSSLKKEQVGLNPLFAGYPRADLFCKLFHSPIAGCTGCFYWVKDGVLVGKELLEPSGNVIGHFYLSDPKVPTDLSGLAMAEALSCEVRVSANQLLADSMTRLHEMLLQRVGDLEPPRRTNISPWEALTAVGAISIIMTNPLGILIMLGGILGMRLSPPKVSSSARRSQELADYVGSLIDEPWQLAVEEDLS